MKNNELYTSVLKTISLDLRDQEMMKTKEIQPMGGTNLMPMIKKVIHVVLIQNAESEVNVLNPAILAGGRVLNNSI